MDDAWRQLFTRKRAHQAGGGLMLRYAHPNGTVVRDDAKPDSGGPGGSDPHFLIKDHLDANDFSVAVLNSLQSGSFCSVRASAEESIVIAQAANDYYLDRYLPIDQRLFYAPVVPPQDLVDLGRGGTVPYRHGASIKAAPGAATVITCVIRYEAIPGLRYAHRRGRPPPCGCLRRSM